MHTKQGDHANNDHSISHANTHDLLFAFFERQSASITSPTTTTAPAAMPPMMRGSSTSPPSSAPSDASLTTPV